MLMSLTRSERAADSMSEKRRYIGASGARVPDPERAIRSGARRAASPALGAIYDTGTAFVLWVSVPIEVRIERAGARKVYIKAKKISWALERQEAAVV
jgi:hypothetical protein